MLTASQEQIVQLHLADWTQEESQAYVFFRTSYGRCPNKPDLFRIAQFISQMAQIPGLNRLA